LEPYLIGWWNFLEKKSFSKNFLDGGSLEGLPTDGGGGTCGV
jgi:hypothetical protein